MRKTYGTRRAAQMAMWLKLAGWRARGSGMLTPLVAQAEAAGGRDAQRLVALMNAVHVAIALMGDELLRAAGLPADAKGQDRFLDWATGLISGALMAEQVSD